jgi:hypothetical protein
MESGIMRTHLRKLLLGLGLFTLAACETTEGYRQQMTMLEGRHADDILIAWGEPVSRSTLSDGRMVWTYDEVRQVTGGGLWRDETNYTTETYIDGKGKKRVRQIAHSRPVYEPPYTYTTRCVTRFVLTPTARVESVNFKGDACVAKEIY